jgi:hypothetical protein
MQSPGLLQPATITPQILKIKKIMVFMRHCYLRAVTTAGKVHNANNSYSTLMEGYIVTKWKMGMGENKYHMGYVHCMGMSVNFSKRNIRKRP